MSITLRCLKRLPRSNTWIITVSNPRDWGTVDFIAGNKLIFSEDIYLAAPNTDAIEALIGQYWQEIQSSGYQRIEYKNVSDWVQKKIEEKLASGRR